MTIILISQIKDSNIFHFFSLEINSVWKRIQNCNDTYLLFLKDYHQNGVHKWRRDLLSCVIPTFTCVNDMKQYCKKNNIKNIQYENINYNEWIINPWQFIDYKPNILFNNFSDVVKNKLMVNNYKGTYATLITRANTRVLYDFKTHILFEENFKQECQNNNIPFKVICFDTISLQEQAEALQDTKVMLSCHGAANTNLFFLPENGHLLEINFRKHWYCDPVCDDHFTNKINYTCKCNGKLTCKPYFHKADYHNLSKFFNKKYTELEFEYSDGFIDRNPINVKNIYVNSRYIMDKVLELFV
jgi:hypothetical protein